jgi:hypothetical protein
MSSSDIKWIYDSIIGMCDARDAAKGKRVASDERRQAYELWQDSDENGLRALMNRLERKGW